MRVSSSRVMPPQKMTQRSCATLVQTRNKKIAWCPSVCENENAIETCCIVRCPLKLAVFSIPMAAAPPVGASMLVVHEPYTSLMLGGMKTHELRAKRVLGKKYLACSTTHMVKALLYFGESRLLSDDDYAASFHEHHCQDLKKRYKTTWSTKILRVVPLKHHVPYKAKPGAIGYARYYG